MPIRVNTIGTFLIEVTQYWTTDLMENPIYVQFNSYWIDIFATGLVPLLFLCYMNMKIFFRIKVSTYPKSQVDLI